MNTNGIALSLAGGGARGAYQAGALLGMAKKGFVFDTIAGTSVGTLNGAFYAQSDGSIAAMQKLCDLWREIATIEMIELDGVGATSELLKVIVLPRPISLLNLFGSDVSLLNPMKIKQVLDKYINYDLVCKSDKNLIITVLSSISPIIDILTANFRNPEYFFANSMDSQTLRRALLAATAIPLAFPSIEINGNKYSDAGLSTPMPSKILYDIGFRRIVSIFLSDNTIQNRFDYAECSLIQIRPSQNIDTSLGTMLDFSLPHITHLIELGEKDAAKYIEGIQEMYKSLLELRRIGDILEYKIENLPKIE